MLQLQCVLKWRLLFTPLCSHLGATWRLPNGSLTYRGDRELPPRAEVALGLAHEKPSPPNAPVKKS